MLNTFNKLHLSTRGKMEEEKYPEGHFVGMWTGIGVAIGSGLGLPIALVLGNMAFIGIGMPIGIAIGVAIGTSQEAKNKAEGKIRALTELEKKRQKTTMWTIMGVLLLGSLILLGILAIS